MMSLNAPMRRLERGDYILCVCVCAVKKKERRENGGFSILFFWFT